jgi:hypothetical protein
MLLTQVLTEAVTKLHAWRPQDCTPPPFTLLLSPVYCCCLYYCASLVLFSLTRALLFLLQRYAILLWFSCMQFYDGWSNVVLCSATDKLSSVLLVRLSQNEFTRRVCSYRRVTPVWLNTAEGGWPMSDRVRYYSNIRLEWLRKTTKDFSQD